MLSTDNDILNKAKSWRREGPGRGHCDRVETWGSAPRSGRQPSRHRQRRQLPGSVSGGCVEGAVVTEAVDVIESGAPRMLEFGVADEIGLARRTVLWRAYQGFRREGIVNFCRV